MAAGTSTCCLYAMPRSALEYFGEQQQPLSLFWGPFTNVLDKDKKSSFEIGFSETGILLEKLFNKHQITASWSVAESINYVENQIAIYERKKSHSIYLEPVSYTHLLSLEKLFGHHRYGTKTRNLHLATGR